MNIVITAGGTGGHIFPALSVALELKKQCDEASILWIGTSRSREKALGEKYSIPVKILNVHGVNRTWSFSSVKALLEFVKAVLHMRAFFKENRPDAIIAFGGYVCAPVLAAARVNNIPYFIQEQNSVPGLVNRIFSAKAQSSFLGYPFNGKRVLKGKTEITGTPVRTVTNSFDDFVYPEGLDRNKKTLLICGGSQGAASMNECLIKPIKDMLTSGLQVIWQTGSVTYEKIANQLNDFDNAFVFEAVDDLYPYYAVADIVICRSGASTLNEVAYFGLPCIMIPLPWAAENHQWMNAEHILSQGWGVRIAQDEYCGEKVEKTVNAILSDTRRYESMCRKALDSSSASSAVVIVQKILERLR